jgi:glycopeptide antibiotics resistance protein
VRTATGRLPGPPRGPLPHQGWLDYLGTYEDVARVAFVLLPIALLVARVLARHRERSDASTQRAWGLSLAEVWIVYLTLPALWITLRPGARAGEAPARVSLVPLHDLATMTTFQIVGNLLLLTGLGFFAPVRFEALASMARVLTVAATLSTSIETAQYVLRLDRVSSVDDVLLNTVGAGLAALMSRRWWRVRRSDAEPPPVRLPDEASGRLR